MFRKVVGPVAKQPLTQADKSLLKINDIWTDVIENWSFASQPTIVWRISMNRGGFSLRRFLGLSAALSKLSRRIGIPLTKSGRQRKLGALIYRLFGL
jgi:hypothetical protein